MSAYDDECGCGEWSCCMCYGSDAVPGSSKNGHVDGHPPEKDLRPAPASRALDTSEVIPTRPGCCENCGREATTAAFCDGDLFIQLCARCLRLGLKKLEDPLVVLVPVARALLPKLDEWSTEPVYVKPEQNPAGTVTLTFRTAEWTPRGEELRDAVRTWMQARQQIQEADTPDEWDDARRAERSAEDRLVELSA